MARLTLTDRIISYESGGLSDEDTVDLFQDLVDSGLAWSLQGSYGRMAARLIEAGIIVADDGRPVTHAGQPEVE